MSTQAKQALSPRDRWTLGLMSSVILLLLILSVSSETDEHRAVEESFHRLRPVYVIPDVKDSPLRSTETLAAQREFKKFGPAASELMVRRIDRLLSTVNSVVHLTKKSLGFSNVFMETWAEQDRLKLGLEALGSAAAPTLTELRKRLIYPGNGPFRTRFMAELISYAGRAGTKILDEELANSNPDVREACREGLRGYVKRTLAQSGAVGVSSISDLTWMALLEDPDPVQRRWAMELAPATFTLDATRLIKEMQSTNFTTRMVAAEGFVAALKANHTDFPAFRSNYVSVFLPLLLDDEPAMRGFAISALVKSGERGPAVMAALERALGDSNSVVRADAADALRELGSQKSGETH
ncbi:MAG: HEAT repeat domain-containing protein [Limisphaerales bacterium]